MLVLIIHDLTGFMACDAYSPGNDRCRRQKNIAGVLGRGACQQGSKTAALPQGRIQRGETFIAEVFSSSILRIAPGPG